MCIIYIFGHYDDNQDPGSKIDKSYDRIVDNILQLDTWSSSIQVEYWWPMFTCCPGGERQKRKYWLTFCSLCFYSNLFDDLNYFFPVISITIHWLLDWSKLIDKKVVPTYCGLIESRWQGWVTVSKITSFLSYQACDYIVCVFTHVVDLTLIECHFNID